MATPIVPKAINQARFVQKITTGGFNRNSPFGTRRDKRKKALFRRTAPIT